MDISQEELANLSKEDIYQKYKDFFENIYYTNNFSISLSNYKTIVYDEIENSKIEYNGKEKYELFIKKRVIKRLKIEDSYQETSAVSEYINDLKFLEKYDKENELEYLKKAQNGDIESRNKIMEGYLKLVINVAKGYLDRGLSYEDLIQEGNFGLIKAIEKYDPSIGCKFITYAYLWIRQAIVRSIDNKARVVRIPVYLSERISEYKKVSSKLNQKLNRAPTVKEIADEMNLSVNEINSFEKYSFQATSLNTKVFDDDFLEVQDIIPDNKTDIEEIAVYDSLKKDVESLLNSGIISKRDLDVIKLRYGFDGNQPLTLEEIGNLYGITRERVRQIENRALNNLRSTERIFSFVDYMNSPKEAFAYIKKIYDFMNARKGNKASDEELIFNEKGEIITNKIKTIYDYFPNHSRFEVNTALSKLTLIEQFFLCFKYGGSLSRPIPYDLTETQKNYFNNQLLPKISTLVRNLSFNNSIEIANDVSLKSNSFTKSDFMVLKICFNQYKRLKKEFKYSFNHFFIERLSDGFVNKKAFSKEDIMKILHITENEYNDCINEDKEMVEALKNTKRIVKKF